jgi:Na+/H+ antiporter NhaD/arsenite permease-like protein
MLERSILAGVTVGVVALWPRSRGSAVLALAAGAVSVALGGRGIAWDAFGATAPMLVFLSVALAAAGLAERAGFAELVASRLASAGAGRTRRLYGFVCATSALLTCAVSLDGAVVLMVPLVRVLARRCGDAFGHI